MRKHVKGGNVVKILIYFTNWGNNNNQPSPPHNWDLKYDEPDGF